MRLTTRLALRNGAPNGAANGAAKGAFVAASGRAAPFAPCPPVLPGGHGGIARAAANGARWNGAENGALDGAPPADGSEVDATFVIARLEEAGETLLCLPASGPSTRLRTSSLDVVRSALESYGHDSGRLRPPVPPAARISRMDETFAWLALIPDDRYVLRRIVASRALVSPTTGRHLFPWRRLGLLLGADHKAIQRWHAQGIDLLVARLNATGGRK